MTEVEAKPLPTAENGKGENKTIHKFIKKEKEKKVTDMTSKIETELSANMITTEVTIGHTEFAVNKESFLKTKHAKDKMINNNILKADINSVLHIEMDRKQGNEKSSTNEGNTDKLIHDLGKPSISNIKGNISQILGGKTRKHDVLAAMHNNIETVGRLDLSRRDVINRKKTITTSQDGNKTVQSVRNISSTNEHNQNSGTALEIQKQSDRKVNNSTFNNTLYQSFEIEQHTSNFSTYLSTEETTPSGTTTELTTTTTKKVVKSLGMIAG